MRIIQFVKKHKSNVLFSFTLNILILGFFMILFTPRFETNDDIAIMNIVNGYNGTHDPHLIFVNYLIGLILSGLYSVCGTISWYVIFWYLITYLSLTAITYVFLNRKCTSLSIGILSLFLAFFGFEGYVLLQFTKVASFAACAGMLLLFWAASSKEKNTLPIICGIALAVLSTMIRFSQALIVMGIMCILGLCFLLCKKEFEDKKVFFKRLATGIISIAIVGVLSLGTMLVDKSAYKSEDWHNYLTFNTARAELVDYGFPNYEANKDAIEALGLSKIDYDMFEDWLHEDWEVFTSENTSELASLRNSKKITVTSIQDFWVEMSGKIGKLHTFVFFSILMILWLCVGKHKKPYILSVTLLFVVTLALYAYMYFVLDRYLLNRVDSGIWMANCLCLMLFMDPDKNFLSKRSLSVLVCLGSIFAIFSGTHFYKLRICSNNAESKAILSVYNEINKDKEHIYITTTSTNKSLGWSYTPQSILDTPDKDYGSNMYSLGGWPARMPVYKDILDKYEITNPIKDMVDNEKVYLVGDDYDLLLKFISYHYDDSVKIEFVKQMGEYPIYRFVTADNT